MVKSKWSLFKWVFSVRYRHREYFRVSRLSLHVDQEAASAAHVAHYVLALTCAVAKNWLMVELVLAIWSIFLGLPGREIKTNLYLNYNLIHTI